MKSFCAIAKITIWFLYLKQHKIKPLPRVKIGAKEHRELENIKKLEIAEEEMLSITKQDSTNKYYKKVIYKSWSSKEANLKRIKLGEEPFLILQSKVDESIKNSHINGKYKDIRGKEYINLSLK